MVDKELTLKVSTETEVSKLEDLAETLEESKEKADELSNSLDGLAADVDTDSITELDEGLESSSESANELSDSLDGIEGSGLNDASSDADSLADGLSNAAGGADDLASSLDGASSSADGLGDSLGVIESASFMGAAEGINQYAAGAENLAQEMNTASISVGQLSTNVGMAEPQMVSLINHISNATFPQAEAMAYVQALNQMGVSAGQLGDAATNMDKINDATGIGYQKVMQLTQGLRSVGVEADNLPSSFNAIAYAQANVNGGADTLSQVLKTQAATINEYGLNVDQLVVIMQKLSEQGVQGRKMGSELSSVLKECNGDTAALEKELGLVPGSLSNASAATGEYTGKLQELADEEAEHKTIVDQLGAAWEDMSLALSPVLSPLASFIGLVGQVGSTAMAINSILTLAETFGILEIANLSLIPSQIAEGIAGWFSVGWIEVAVIAIVALIAILAYLYYTNEDVRNAIDWLAESFMNIVGVIYNDLVAALEWLMGAWQNTVDFISQYGQLFLEIFFVIATGGVGAIFLLLANMQGMPSQLGGYLQSALNYVVSFASNFITRIYNAGVNSVSRFIGQISQLPGKLANELNNMLGVVSRWAATLPQKFWDAGVNAVKNFLSALGIASPGYMQVAMITELDNTARRIPNVGDKIVGNVGRVAGDIVESWGDPSLNAGMNGNSSIGAGSGVDGTAGGGVTINVYGDVDSEERMMKFVDAVRRELFWNNATAGRGV